MRRLADRVHVVAPDYPGFGQEGPPFSVPPEEVERLYGAYGEVRALARNSVLSREQHFADRRVTQLSECAYLVTLNGGTGR